jgi:hypothetical protein
MLSEIKHLPFLARQLFFAFRLLMFDATQFGELWLLTDCTHSSYRFVVIRGACGSIQVQTAERIAASHSLLIVSRIDTCLSALGADCRLLYVVTHSQPSDMHLIGHKQQWDLLPPLYTSTNM